MTKITINVTEKHIREGKRGDCAHCPIALAVGEATGTPQTAISVGPERFVLLGTHRGTNLPAEARQFISLFDSEHHVKPFSFEVDLVPLTKWSKP